MRDQSQFDRLFAGAGEAAGPGAGLEPPAPLPFARRTGGALLIDTVLGLGARAVLIVQLWTWSRAHAEPVQDPFSWWSWVSPDAGLERAAGVWMFGQIDPAQAALILLMTATGAALLLALGLLTRLAGLLVLAGAVWHSVFILPDAWPSNAAYMMLGAYLMLRGAGAVSIDWVLARLARLG